MLLSYSGESESKLTTVRIKLVTAVFNVTTRPPQRIAATWPPQRLGSHTQFRISTDITETSSTPSTYYEDDSKMEVIDWDHGTRYLYGLVRKPPTWDDLVQPFTERQVQHELKTISVRLYNQQRLIPMFESNVKDGRNPLAYLLCASYESSPSSSPERNERPRLRSCTPLPLAHWDRLYYVICAEIRQMYSALEAEFGIDFRGGAKILHEAGPEGISGSVRHPVSAIGLAQILEATWIDVTDDRLKTPLNAALGGDLVNTDSMEPDDIVEMVWSKLLTKVRRRSSDETLLARCRAEVREMSTLPQRKNSKAHSRRSQCKCSGGCSCRKLCDLKGSERRCIHKYGHKQEMVENKQCFHNEVQAALIRTSTGDVQNTIPQPAIDNPILSQPADMARQLSPATYACSDCDLESNGRNLNDQRDSHGTAGNTVYDASRYGSNAGSNGRKSDMTSDLVGVQETVRKRTGTNASDLAYVPAPRTPTRGKSKKDAYPLGFYGNNSGHRYPEFRGTPESAPPPVCALSSDGSQVPARKPVPCIISKRSEDNATCESNEISQTAYEAIAASENNVTFTQSFPSSVQGNPRHLDAAHDDTKSYFALIEESHNEIRPFSDEATLSYPDVTRLRLQTTAIVPADAFGLARSRKDRAADANNPYLAKELPSLPLPLLQPDFIAPRPALKQRYVSAGGNAKLSDREEISGPGMSTAHTPLNHGAPSVPKEKLFELLEDEDFIRANFGEAAVSKMGKSPENSTRPSAEASVRPSTDNSPSKSGKGSSSRTSQMFSQRDSKVEISSGRRERTESGGSFSMKLKRVFSRKSNEDEW
ncbi:hypothetical protein LTR62_005326 [Meristemomyces frigidus]|uniref:Uncharacterized protein n=1 Tax=Meristemomyces frigidus TaxID=1508187 RepID=A0AAN7TFJ3_9PEZI|nr:hypothetical protein LTR62_005326 [Meristemomyces frigidus]